MKHLHRPDLFGWTQFDTDLNLDCHSLFWVRHEGNVVFDPLPASDHDLRHMAALGGVSAIVLTCPHNERDGLALAEMTGAEVYGPARCSEQFTLECDHWLEHGPTPFTGLEAIQVKGSRSAGELCYMLDGSTLLFGDLLRGPLAGSLSLLAPDLLGDQTKAIATVRKLAAMDHIESVWVANGWPLFHRAGEKLRALSLDLG